MRCYAHINTRTHAHQPDLTEKQREREKWAGTEDRKIESGNEMEQKNGKKWEENSKKYTHTLASMSLRWRNFQMKMKHFHTHDGEDLQRWERREATACVSVWTCQERMRNALHSHMQGLVDKIYHRSLILFISQCADVRVHVNKFHWCEY